MVTSIFCIFFIVNFVGIGALAPLKMRLKPSFPKFHTYARWLQKNLRKKGKIEKATKRQPY